MPFIFLFVFSALSDEPACSDLDFWLLDCPIINTEDSNVTTIVCPEDGYYEIACTPRVSCTGDAVRTIRCVPTNGKSPGVALILSVFFGMLGIDRFYLGYPTLGIFKLITGGFFGIGWHIDIFLIALQIVKPSRGGVYRYGGNPLLRIRLPEEEYY